MDASKLDPQSQQALDQMLGYLNYSSGSPDAHFRRSANELFRRLEHDNQEADGTWQTVGRLLLSRLAEMRGTTAAFGQVDQVASVLRLVFDHVLPAYRSHHRDLLFHQRDATLYRPFFLARVCEEVLSAGSPWDQPQRIVEQTLARLNDFIGHRPVAVLRTPQKIEPYAHERVCPIPLYFREGGVAGGRYAELIGQALKILRTTDADVLADAWFEPELLDELSLDPRAYDFNHPIDRRPNYVFGEWDPEHLDGQGRYRRFVVRQVTLDSLLEQVKHGDDELRDERLFEAAAVLACTTLMASGISGRGPETHDSSVTLATLVPHIARYRDAFYQQLIPRAPHDHQARLRAEAKSQKQPFAAARGALNRSLARRRSAQLVHAHLARIVARMGYGDAARRKAAVVPVASARMICEIQCLIMAAHHQIDRGAVDHAFQTTCQAEDWFHRAIECGALVDPWNVLGFQANFSLFRALENSVHDHRVDQLLEIVDQIFDVYARLMTAGAAGDEQRTGAQAEERMRALADWWDRFATCEVEGVAHILGRDRCDSAAHVAAALAQWHRASAAAGDIAFWHKHVQKFESPGSYAVAVETLLDHDDLVAAMALLMQWLSRADDTALGEGKRSFHTLTLRWMDEAVRRDRQGSQIDDSFSDDRWSGVKKFFDFAEANADERWRVPDFRLASPSDGNSISAGERSVEPDETDELDGLFAAAYENVTFRDSALDGELGDVLEEGPGVSDFEFEQEARRVAERLALPTTAARLWKIACRALLRNAHEMSIARPDTASAVSDDVASTVRAWLTQARENRQSLIRLMRQLHAYPIPAPGVAHSQIVEYDHRRRVQHALLRRAIIAYAETSDAARWIGSLLEDVPDGDLPGTASWETAAIRLLRSMEHGHTSAIESQLANVVDELQHQPLLLIPLERGGDPVRIAAVRDLHRLLVQLFSGLARLGMFAAVYRLIDVTQTMEAKHPVGPGSVTIHDRLFEVGYRSLVENVVRSFETWDAADESHSPLTDTSDSLELEIVELLETLTEPMLERWLEHSRSIRLSVLETVADEIKWETLVGFVERYGTDLFTQPFFNPGNLRAILDQGADYYLRCLDEEAPRDARPRLLDELERLRSNGNETDRREGQKLVAQFRVVVEAVAEDFPEYNDYNNTTTQSDRPELLHTLLNFLRLKASYDRVAWHLRPVMLAHAVLARRRHDAAAETWRRNIAAKTNQLADWHLHQLQRLQHEYGMRLQTIADRLGERFTLPFALDLVLATVEPAVEAAHADESREPFQVFERLVGELAQQGAGVGLDVPQWIEVLDDEVQRVLRCRGRAATWVDPFDDSFDGTTEVPWALLSRRELRRRLEALATESSDP